MPPFRAPVEDILATASTQPYKQFVLFGDSITQGSFDQSRGFALGAQLSHDYARRLDVVNRGLNGYQTDQALAITPYIFPPPATSPKIDYLLLFFGANDSAYAAAGPSENLVPLDRYRDNLLSIARHPAVLAHDPRIVLVTPPPVDEHQRPVVARADGTQDRGRDAGTTARYARVAREVGEELIREGREVVVLDLWGVMMGKAGWSGEGEGGGEGELEGEGDGALPGSLGAERNAVLAGMLYDGLHFGPGGYEVLYGEVRRVMRERWPDSVPEGMGLQFPEHGEWF